MDPCQGSIVPMVDRNRARMTVCGHDAAGRRIRDTPGVPGRGRSVHVHAHGPSGHTQERFNWWSILLRKNSAARFCVYCISTRIPHLRQNSTWRRNSFRGWSCFQLKPIIMGVEKESKWKKFPSSSHLKIFKKRPRTSTVWSHAIRKKSDRNPNAPPLEHEYPSQWLEEHREYMRFLGWTTMNYSGFKALTSKLVEHSSDLRMAEHQKRELRRNHQWQLKKEASILTGEHLCMQGGRLALEISIAIFSLRSEIVDFGGSKLG